MTRDVQDISWSKHPNKRFSENLLEFWSQTRWHFRNDPGVSDCRITWQELLFDFLAEFGPVRGFLEPNVRLSLLTHRFRDHWGHSGKLLSAAGTSVVGFSNVSHLRCFTGGNAAGICARRLFMYPEVIWAFLLSQCRAGSERSAVGRSRPNAHYIPSWDFLLPWHHSFSSSHPGLLEFSFSLCDATRLTSRMLRGSCGGQANYCKKPKAP